MTNSISLGDGIKLTYDREDRLITVTGLSWMGAHDPSRDAEVVGRNPGGAVFLSVAPPEQFDMCNRRFA